MKKPAVFMDRDGTVNEQMGYINHADRFILLPGVGKAIHLLNEAGYLAIIVSNQSGVARGYFPLELVHRVHDKMKRLIKMDGAILDGVYFCPHYPEGKIPPFKMNCNCRKPGTGLIQAAEAAFDIDRANSWVIGDRCTDVEMAQRAGLKSILVKTGYGRGDLQYVFPRLSFQPDHVAEDLLDAVKWILG